ncbi:MAG: hypothetical protein V4642_06355 [Bacteroidota bacterium]
MTANRCRNRLQLLIVLLICLPLFGLFSFTDCRAQDIRDSKGKEFWLTFLPNFHNMPDALEDSLYIFITAEQPASGTIEYFDIFGTRYDTSFSIAKDQFFIFSKVFRDFELSGYNSPGGNNNNAPDQEETYARQAFKITSSSDVTVYGLNQARTTSDAFIGLPSDVLGQEYMIMSYPTDVDTPSEFAVLATKNNTKITISPTAPTSKSNSTAVQNITLNEGQVWLVQTSQDQADLTGTKITSTQPIAVFAGHQRAKIPNPSSLVSRDHLIEELPPIPTWGGSAFVTPYPLAMDANTKDFDVYRVLAANNSTKVYVDGVFNRTLNSGEFFDGKLIKSEWITATGPILVAQFKKSSNESGSSFGKTGDPFMIINSPTEQYLKRFHCFNIKAWEREDFGTPVPVYDDEQYLTIIVPTDSLATVKLDGVLINPARFKTLSITSYSYTDSMRVSTGIHTVESNSKMGVYVYGYGAANSYGYIGGMGYDTIYTFNPPDIIPPLILGSSSCGVFKGGAFDTLSFDRGIKSIETIPSGIINANVTLGAIISPAAKVAFNAQLIDPFKDGKIAVMARDSSDGHREQAFDIPGFTVRASLSNGTNVYDTTETTKFKIAKCISVELTNYGKFPQTVTSFDFSNNNPHYSVSTALPFKLLPGEKKLVQVCMDATVSGRFSDTLVVSTPCIKRSVVAITFTVESRLGIGSKIKCFDINGSFYDTTAVKINIQAVATVPGSLKNATVQIDPKSSIPGWDSLSFTATLIDPFFDGSGSISASNEFGVQGEINFEIPGFTVHPDPVAFKSTDITREVRAKKQICFPVLLKNYGKFPQNITKSNFKNSASIFSITPSTLTIAPGAEETLQVCFFADDAGQFDDSLFIGNDCISRPVAYFSIKALRDSVTPGITRASDSCELQDNILLKDDLEFDWGIKSFTISEQTNAVVSVDSSALPLSVSFTARSIDRRSDARYRIQVIDSADNVRDTTFIIQGFTLQVLDVDTERTHQFDSLFTLTTNCETIKIYNSSELPFILDNATLAANVNFSAPLSQFPIVIPPKDTGNLIICFDVDNHRDYTDSISLKKYCIEDIFGLRGSKKDEIFSGSSECDVRVQLSSKTIPGQAFVEKSFPNPAQDVATLRFGVASAGKVQIILFDAMGNQVAIFTDAQYNSGIYELKVATDTFKSGQYYYKFTAPGHEEMQPMTIIK